MTLAGLPGRLYNLRQVFKHGPKNLGTFLELNKEMESTSSFYHSELLRALKEQAFGIKKFTISSSSGQQAIAAVVLLDGAKLLVQLTTQGYSVSDRSLLRFCYVSDYSPRSPPLALPKYMKPLKIYCKQPVPYTPKNAKSCSTPSFRNFLRNFMSKGVYVNISPSSYTNLRNIDVQPD